MSVFIWIALSLLVPAGFIAAVMAKAYSDEEYIAQRTER